MKAGSNELISLGAMTLSVPSMCCSWTNWSRCADGPVFCHIPGNPG